MIDFDITRKHMVEEQLMPAGIKDRRLLAVMENIPRELFVPKDKLSIAYCDNEIMLNNVRCLLSPTSFALLAQLAKPDESSLVLDIACGSGYSSAILSRLAGMVVGLESQPHLRKTGTGLDMDNVMFVEGPLEEGFLGEGPYDVILINGKIEHIPPMLLEQLVEGGRLVCFMGGETTKAICLTKTAKAMDIYEANPAAAPRLAEFQEKEQFQL